LAEGWCWESQDAGVLVARPIEAKQNSGWGQDADKWMEWRLNCLNLPGFGVLSAVLYYRKSFV
jgi:hypothetical protein